MLEVFKLDEEFSPDSVDGTLVRTRKHENVHGAYTYEFITKNGKLFATAIKGKLQEICYESPSLFPWQRKKKWDFLLASYFNGEWKEIHKDKNEQLFHSDDEMFYASAGNNNRRFSFGTMLFQDEKFRAVN